MIFAVLLRPNKVVLNDDFLVMNWLYFEMTLNWSYVCLVKQIASTSKSGLVFSM